MGRQGTKQRRGEAERAKAQAFVEKLEDEAIRKNRSRKPVEEYIQELGITAEAIVKARDEDGLSWRDVAKVLGLPYSGSARRAYRQLTGKSPTESTVAVKRAPRGSRKKVNAYARPQWNDESDQTEIVSAIEGNTITVNRMYGTLEEIQVMEVLYFVETTTSGKPCDLAVEFVSGYRDTKGNRQGVVSNRTVNVKDIVEVR